MISKAEKLSKIVTVEQHSFRRCYTNAQQRRSTTLPPEKNKMISKAEKLSKVGIVE